MDSEARTTVRRALRELGFTRTGYTRDHGDGDYTETYADTVTTVTVSWGVRTPDTPPARGVGAVRDAEPDTPGTRP